MVILPGVSGVACTSTGTSKPRQPQRIGNGALVAEIGQRHDDAVDPVRDVF